MGSTMPFVYSSLSSLYHLCSCVRTSGASLLETSDLTAVVSGDAEDVRLTSICEGEVCGRVEKVSLLALVTFVSSHTSISSMVFSSARLGISMAPLTLVPSGVVPVFVRNSGWRTGGRGKSQ